ncbi:hypothetical protein ACHAXS_002788 [Conticribra weissflogii]
MNPSVLLLLNPAEIERVMKKVDEGVELFDEIWEKVYSAEQQNQKEKYEVELKKEIKKLQRLRDQIKTWIGSSEVKDKDSLIDARKLIETKMEQFKVCEKETKTKTYSKEGLAREDKLDPAEQAKEDTVKWISEIIERLQELIDEREVEIERLSSGKGKKTNKNLIEDSNQFILNHKYHINKLEGIMRLVRNDRLDPETVDELREDLEYYLDSYEEEDYLVAYDEDGFYDSLGLSDLDVVNVDRVTQVAPTTKKKDDDTSASSGSRKQDKAKKASATSGMIPLTIGRARVSSAGTKDKEASSTVTPTKVGRSSSTVSNGPAPAAALGPAPTPTPKAPPAPPSGASMAAVLKRESEERQKAALAAQQQEQARQAELLRQQQLQKQQQEAQLRQQEALRQQQLQAQQQKAAQAEALKRQQAQQLLEQQRQQQAAQQDAATKQKLLQQQQAAQQQQQAAQQAAKQQGTVNQNGLSGLNVGLSGLSLAQTGTQSASQQQSIQLGVVASGSKDANERYLNALNDSFMQMPTGADSERQRTYTPRNPYPTPSCYPTTPSPIFENPAVFEKLGTDALFFIFYYAQGTYQQYLAARELKKQSWRYHKKYMTWFQRHEEPKVTTDDYEQGTYVYFDYETGWCQRIKSDFRFEYSYLEDSL